MEKEVTLNVITLGASGVGKTSILNRIKDKKFHENVQTTLTTETFFIKRKYEKKNLMMNLKFLDTMGQEGAHSLIPIQYIRNSPIVLLVFDKIETLNDIKNRWLGYYKNNVNIKNSRFLLIGNKSDIFGDDRETIIQCGEQFGEEINAHFMTCSAKSNDNMDNLERFIVLEAKRFIDELEKELDYDIANNRKLGVKNKFNLDNKNGKKKKSCAC